MHPYLINTPALQPSGTSVINKTPAAFMWVTVFTWVTVMVSTPFMSCCRLCELNVIRQVYNVCSSPTVQAAWDAGKPLSIHGLAYSLKDGLLKVHPCFHPLTHSFLFVGFSDRAFSRYVHALMHPVQQYQGNRMSAQVCPCSHSHTA